MSTKHALRAIIVAILASSVACPASAEPVTDAARVEAHDRFEHALRLFNGGDNAPALAEFKRVYELVENPVVLYNIGLVSAAMGRPVDAVEALDRLLAAPGSLSAERLARAKTTRQEQITRVATLAVTASVPGAAIAIDNLEAAKAPLARPIRVSSGTHVVGVVAPGYAPQYKEIAVAGQTEAAIAFELVPMQGRLAHLTLATHVPAVEVVVDGALAGKTPLPASLTLAPGPHAIELRRAGYLTQRRDLTLGDGATGEIALDLDEDAAAIRAGGGTLALAISEPQAVVTVDGRSRGADAPSLRLAGGVHRLRVERAGFAVVERDVDVAPGRTVTIAVALEPNPDTLAAYVHRAALRRTLGWISVAGGAALAGGGVGFLVYNAGPKGDAQASFDAIDAEFRAMTGRCDIAGGANHKNCNDQWNSAKSTIDALEARDAVGYVGIGIGAAAITAGVVLLAGGDDPRRYDRKPSGETLARVRPLPMVWRAPGGGGIGLVGSF